MGNVRVGVDFDAQTAGFVRDVGLMRATMKAFKRDVEGIRVNLKNLSTDLDGATKNFKKLDTEIGRSSHASRALSLNFYELRNALRNLASRSIIIGFTAITGAIGAIGAAATLAAGSLANLAGALAFSGGAGIAAGLQGVAVAALGLNGIMKAVTTTGKEHEAALDKLTVTAKKFAKELHPVLIGFREIKLIAQEGLFPGLTRAVEKAMPLLKVFKQVVYDTALQMGYLAERGAQMLSDRKGLLSKVLENNVILIQKYGRSIENFGAGMLEGWVAAIPLIDHVAGKVEKFSKSFKTSMREWRKDGSLGDFFNNLKTSFDNWMKIAKGFGETFFNVWDASQGAIHLLEKDLGKVFGKMADWTKNHKLDISTYMVRMLEPTKAMARFIGESIKLFVRLSDIGSGTITHLFNGLTDKLLPIIEELALMLQRDFVAGIGHAMSSLLDFVAVALPSFELILKPLGLIAEGFAAIIDTMRTFVDWGTSHFGKIGGVITTALSVGAIAATWIALRTQIAMTLAVLGRGAGGVRRLAAVPMQTVGSQAKMAAQGSIAYATAGRGSSPILTGRRAAQQRRQIARIPTAQPVPRVYSASPTNPWFDRGNPLATRPYYAQMQSEQYVPTRYRQQPGVSMKRGAGTSVPPLRPTVQMASPIPVVAKPKLKGGEGAVLFKQYRDSMEQETKKGFLGGLKNIKGSAAVGAISGLAGSLGLALAVPIGIAAIGALSKALKDNRPKIQKQVEDLTRTMTGDANQTRFRGEKFGKEQFNAPTVGPLRNLGAQIAPAIKSLDATKLRNIAGAMAELAKKTADVGKANEIKKLSDDVQSLAAKASNALLGQLAPDFQTFSGATKDSIDHVLDGLSVLQVQITAKLPVGSREYKEAMASSFGQAADAIQESMDRGLISAKKGLSEIKKLVFKQFTELGFTPEQAKHLADPKNKSGDPTGKQGGNENPGGMARGGYVGGKGRVGRDSVPMNFNGRPVVTAPGEYIGVFTRHQQRTFEQSTGMGMSEFFEHNKTPHYAAKGGMFNDKGAQLQLPASFKPTHQTDGLPGFPAIDVFAQPGTRVLSPASGTISKLSGQKGGPGGGGAYGYSIYITSGKKTYFLTHFGSRSVGRGDKVHQGEGIGTVADYPGGVPDHIHEGLNAAGLKMSGGSGGVTITPIDTPKVSNKGLIGAYVRAGLSSAAGVANAALSKAASAFGGGPEPSLGDGALKGGGSAAANQSLAKSMMAQFGWGASEWPSLQALGMGESQWSTTALNSSSGAFGIGQFLGATKDTYAKYGATSTEAGPQINAMLHYIKDTYGSPSSAYSTWLSRSPHWYAAGGVDPPPTTGNTVPTVDPDDAITDQGSSEKAKKKKKKKKKKVVRIAGNRPTIGAGVGVNKFKPSSRKPKAKARKKVGELISKQFTFGDPTQVDPITGEQIGTYAPLLSIDGFENRIESAGGLLDSIANTSGLTEEQAIVTLYDSDQFADLTNYLTSIGEDPTKWIDKNGDSADVINASGMNVQGQFTRGISQAVAELTQELLVHEGPRPDGGTPIMTALQQINTTADSIPAKRAIAERVKRLAVVKKIFEANVKLRKSYSKKLKAMGDKSYTWQKAVEHNSDLITDWRRWKRDSINEPQADTDTANNEIDRLTDLNKDLRRKKPKGTVYGSQEYQRTLQTYQGRGVENRMLVGDKDALEWNPSGAGGFAGGVFNSISAWRDIDDQRTSILGEMPGRISTEKSNIETLRASIKDWTGTVVPPRPVDRTPADTSKDDRLLELDKLTKMDQLRDALLGNAQFGVLSKFASLLGMRMLGAYAHGGLVPQTGMALVHKGEYITPSPDGPFRNGMNAQGGSGNVYCSVEVVMKDKADALVDFVDARVRQVAPSEVSRASGRNTRRIAAAPGRTR